MPQFYILYLFPDSDVEWERVRKTLNKCLDWFALGNGTYVIYSKADKDRLYKRFGPLCVAGGHFFFCELNVANSNGWMPQDLWDWLAKDRETA